jgi:hypothetical protein
MTNGDSNSLHVQTSPKVNCYTDSNENEHVNSVYSVSSDTCHTIQTNQSANGNSNDSATNYASKQ